MHLKAHRFFAMVAVTGSFSATARHFQVPASSVSRFIAALEREVGQQLLYRNTRAVTLTEAGERYYLQIREVLDLLDAADEQVTGKGGGIRGLVRINAPVALGHLHIVKLLDGLYQRYPELTVELTVSDVYIDPVQEGFDLTFRVGHLQDSALIGRKICDQHFVLCASPAYVQRYGEPKSPDDLRNHQCLVYKGSSGPQRWHLRKTVGGAAQVIDVNGPLRSNNAQVLVEAALSGRGLVFFEQPGREKHQAPAAQCSNNAQVLVEAALSGRGLVFFPTWLFEKAHFTQGKLVRLLPQWCGSVEEIPSPIHLISPENRLRSQKTRAVWDYFLEAIGSPPYWDDLGD